MKGNIEDFISRDRTNPTTKRHLTATTGLDERSVRSRIADARRRGIPVVGLLTGGYYITADPDEWRAFVEQERRRAVATFKKTALLDAGVTGQMTIFDEAAQAPEPGSAIGSTAPPQTPYRK